MRQPKAFLTSVIFALLAAQALADTVNGVVQNAQGGPLANGTFTFALTQPVVLSGTATIIPSQVNCYTDSQGNAVGLPTPAAASLSTNLGSGTLPAGTYYIETAWANSTGTSEASSEQTQILASQGTLIVTAPANKQPASATQFKVYIGSTSGGETLQGTVSISGGTFAPFQQSTALAAGSAVPVSNTSVCSIHFNDEFQPSFVCYDVGLTTQSGVTVPGYPQYWYLAGGSSGTVNLSQGTPQSNVCQGQGVFYPQAILAMPQFGATQTIGGSLVTSLIANGSPWLDVKAKGANGTGGDDTTAIQTAINAASSGTVFFPDGTYGLSAQLSIANKTNFKLLLSPGATILALAGLGANPLAQVSGASTKDVTVEGGVWNGASIADICVYVSAGTNVTVKNTDCGFNAAGGPVSPGGIGSRGFFTGTFPTKLTINGNYVHNITGGHGIYCTGVQDCEISHNRVDGNALGWSAINHGGTFGSIVTNNTITMTHGSSFNDRGIGSFAAYNFTIANNVVRGTPGSNFTAGMLIYPDTGINGTISGNTLEGNGSYIGIEVEVPRNVIVTGNTIQDTASSAVQSTGRADAFQVNALDATTGLTFATNVTGSVDAGDKQEGTGSVQAIIGAPFTTGPIFYQAFGSPTDLSQPAVPDGNARDLVQIWIKSDTDILPGVLQMQLSSTAALGNPVLKYNLPYITAGSWVQLRMDAPMWYTLETSILSWGIVAISDPGAITLHFDDFEMDTTREQLTVTGNTARRNGQFAVLVGGVNDSTVTGNTISGPGWYGATGSGAAAIRVGSVGQNTVNTSNVVVSNNVLRTNGSLPPFTYGVQAVQSAGTFDSVRFIGNDIQGFSNPIAQIGSPTNVAQALNYTSATATSTITPGLAIGGIINSYNGIATTGNGVPSEPATVDLTNQGAVINTTTLYAVPASGAGQYRLTWDAKVTTAATTGAATSTLGALTIVYTDPDGVAQTITAPASIAAGTIATTSTGNSTTTVLLGLPLQLNCKASTNITYAFNYVSDTAGQMKYNLHIKLEAL